MIKAILDSRHEPYTVNDNQLNNASRASRLGFSKWRGVGAGLQTSRGFYILVFSFCPFTFTHILLFYQLIARMVVEGVFQAL